MTVGVQASINTQTQGTNTWCIMLAMYSCLLNLLNDIFFPIQAVVG